MTAIAVTLLPSPRLRGEGGAPAVAPKERRLGEPGEGAFRYAQDGDTPPHPPAFALRAEAGDLSPRAGRDEREALP
jgi:hypothetical protein